MAANFAKLPELCGGRTTESFPDEPRRSNDAVSLVGRFAFDRLLSGDGSHLCPQATHDFRDPTSGCYFNTAEIPRRFHVAAFRHLQCTRAMFGGERCNYFNYPWNGGDCHLQKVFLCRTQRHCHRRCSLFGYTARLKLVPSS